MKFKTARSLTFACKPSDGFTLIETLIYIAFFALLVGSLLGVTFQTIASADQVQKKIVIQQEGNFILKKIGWAMGSASDISVPDPQHLTVTRYASPVSITFANIGSNVQMDGQNLNSQNVQITDFSFVRNTNGIQIWLTAYFKISGQDFKLTKYIRK